MSDNAQMRESAQEEQKPAANQSDDELERLRARVSELERANELVADLQAGRSFLLSERASREKQEPVAWYIDGENGREYNGTPKMSDGRSGTPLYAAPPVAAPVRLTDSDVVDLFQAWNMNDGASYADLIRSVETAVLRANGFKVEV